MLEFGVPHPSPIVLALAALSGIAGKADVQGAGLPAPALRTGDSWVFDSVSERGAGGQSYSEQKLDVRIDRIDGDQMVVGMKQDGAPREFEDHIYGVDWSQRRLQDGKQIAAPRPLSFPLLVGQTWTSDYDDPQTRGQQTFAHIHRVYKVVGWEDVTVPAGTFHALKVQQDGTAEAKYETPAVAASRAEASPLGSTVASQARPGGVQIRQFTTYSALYYVPEVKYWVKAVEEQYNADGVLVLRKTDNLVSYKPAG